MTLWVTLFVFFYLLGGVALSGIYTNRCWERSDSAQGRLIVMFILLGPAYWVREKIFRRRVV